MTEPTTETASVADPRMESLKHYIEMTDRKRALEAQLKDLKGRLAELEPQIAEYFQQQGVQNINVNGYTVYLQRQLYAGPTDGDKAAMIAALKYCGDESWSFLVAPSVNTNQLSARVRECDLDDQGMPILPAELADVIHIGEVFRIGARKSS